MTENNVYNPRQYRIPASEATSKDVPLFSTETDTSPVRLTRRGRLVRSVAALALTPVALISASKGIELTTDRLSPSIECSGEQDVVAEPGDGLWSIASREISHTEEVPTRQMADEIEDRNPEATEDGIQQYEALVVPEECENK